MFKISISESPLVENQTKVRDERWRTKLKSGYREIEVSFDKLYRVVQSDYRLYSAGTFNDNFAKDENWTGQDLLILDIDDGLPIQQALEKFKEYMAMIHTSASHQKDKKGVKCDRYRVIIPLTKRTSCTKDEYKDTMKLLSEKVYNFIDHKCVDAARIYFGAAHSEIYYTEGTKHFNFNEYLEIMRQRKKIQAELKAPSPIQKQYTEGENIIEKFNQDHTVEEMLERNHYKRQGDRYVSPNSSTGIAGVILSQSDDGKTWAYNHHSSDDWENCDSYGIYCAIEYNGDTKEAFKSLIQNQA